MRTNCSQLLKINSNINWDNADFYLLVGKIASGGFYTFPMLMLL